MNSVSNRIHATSVAIDGFGVAIIGKSGSGKSDLALRLIDRGAVLVCDDAINLIDQDGGPWIHVSPNIEGKLEVRGLGIVSTPYLEKAPLRLVVNLDLPPERHPISWPFRNIGNFATPELRLNAFEASAPIKVEQALQRLLDQQFIPVRQAGSAS
ncbi:HPr kinase/phosphorylase [Sphingorhabdus pulchriflava]|uniref:HPr kinase/phosphorylase n=1 Tax=Sphingorhabdus pulchriflava TaxID=2292257 RepID=UPI001EF08A5E|nr:HPr kinase/phosphatase C-terminal domain-containing protein [Sphingorhabdus pulchriflava]